MTEQEFKTIEQLFIDNSNPLKIQQMTSYMKGKFKYLGITSPVRKELLSSIFKGFTWTRSELLAFAEHCWLSPFRELQYAGMDLLQKHTKKLELQDIPFLESLILRKSWWDSVDNLAVHPIGKTLKKDAALKKKWVIKWANSDHIWLRRTAILHQLKYKSEVDVDLLNLTLTKANGTKEFFLNKAIGWMLREYSRTNPEFVIRFCDENELSSLSRREATRLLGI